MMNQQPEKKRISLFIDELTTGGAQRFFVFLSRELVKLGHDVDLVVLSESGHLFSQVDTDVNIVNLSTLCDKKNSFIVGLVTLFRLSRYLRRRQPHGLISTITGCNLLAVVAWTLAGKPGNLVLREATSLKNVSSKLRLFFMSLLYKRASAVTALTSTHAAEFEKALSLKKSRLQVVGNPIDVEFLENAESQESPKLHELKPFIVSVGRLTKAKNFSALIRSYALVDSTEGFPNLVIVGDGPEKESLKSLIFALSLEKRVFLVGNSESPSSWYKNAKAFVLSSLWEGYPNALLEALYFKLPVLVTRYDKSLEEIVEALNVKFIYYSEVNDLNGLAKGLKELNEAGGKNSINIDSLGVVGKYQVLVLGNDSYQS